LAEAFPSSASGGQMEVFLPSILSYSILLLACSRCGDFKAAQHWMSSMEADGIKANQVDSNPSGFQWFLI